MNKLLKSLFSLLNIKIKLNLFHLLLLLVVVLLLSSLGFTYKEYFANNDQSALPEGISKSDIPPGEEDKYILKSEIVPPVCPKCPDINVDNINKKCPPCPACARCPESSFECKKVPNYNASNDTNPRPILTDFSQFGM